MVNKERQNNELREGMKLGKNCVCFNLRKTTRVVTQIYDRIMKPSGLNGTQFTLLTAVAIAGSPTIANLAKNLLMDRTTLTRNIKPLEKQELLIITAGEDQRTRIVTLTDQGENMLSNALPYWNKAQKSIIESYGEDRWESTMSDLKELITIAQKI